MSHTPITFDLSITDPLLKEAMRYLGIPQWQPDQAQETREMASEMKIAFEEIAQAAAPKVIFGFLKADEPYMENLLQESRDLHRHLGHCSQVVLMATTLGAGVDRLIDRALLLNPANATFLDAAANALIEAVCDQLELHIAAETGTPPATTRFSPGYGDLPLETNRSLLSFLKAEKHIGVTATRQALMIPRKSVTALFGMHPVLPIVASGSDPSFEKKAESAPVMMGCRSGNCAVCPLRETCTMRNPR